MEDTEKYISKEDTLSRLVRLETKVCLKFDEMERALVLAREQTHRELNKAFSNLDIRLEGMNEFRRQIDRTEGKYATKEATDKELIAIKEMMSGELAGVKRLVYIGVGIVLALEVLLRFIIKTPG